MNRTEWNLTDLGSGPFSLTLSGFLTALHFGLLIHNTVLLTYYVFHKKAFLTKLMRLNDMCDVPTIYVVLMVA